MVAVVTRETQREMKQRIKDTQPGMYSVTYLPMEKVRPASFNPARRILPRNLIALSASIQRHGMPVPIVVTAAQEGLHEIGDGHRRFASANFLGWRTIPAVIWPDVTSQEIWTILNANQMGMTPAQWLEAVALGLSISQPEIPDNIRRDIQALFDVVDENTLGRIIEEGRSPNIYISARRLAKRLDMNTPEGMRRIIQWFMDYNSQNKVRHILYRTDDRSAELVKAAILDGRDLQFSLELI